MVDLGCGVFVTRAQAAIERDETLARAEDAARFPRAEVARYIDGPREEEYSEHYGEPRDDRDSFYPRHPDDR
jgi:hypothetical protein